MSVYVSIKAYNSIRKEMMKNVFDILSKYEKKRFAKMLSCTDIFSLFFSCAILLSCVTFFAVAIHAMGSLY